MISHQFKVQIENFHSQVSEENPFFTQIQAGAFTRSQLTDYLSNILYLVQHTPVHLKKAIRRAHELNRHELARYLEAKFKEEQGHDAWAESDLKNNQATSPSAIKPALKTLIEQIEATIEEDPRLYLGYIFLAEYFTVIAAPDLLGNLEKKCGIKPQEVSVVSNHATLDVEHADEGMDALEQFIEVAIEDRAIQKLSGYIAQLDRFYREVAQTGTDS